MYHGRHYESMFHLCLSVSFTLSCHLFRQRFIPAFYFCAYNSGVSSTSYKPSHISHPTTFCHFLFMIIAIPQRGIAELQNIMRRPSVIADGLHIECVNSSAVEIKCRAYNKSKSAPMSAKPTLTKSPSMYRDDDIWYIIDYYRAQPGPNTLLLATMDAHILPSRPFGQLSSNSGHSS